MIKIAVIMQHSPFASGVAREAQDMLFALAAVEHQLTVIYRGDALYQLLTTRSDANVGCKDFTVAQKLFGLYEIEQVLVDAAELVQYHVDPALCRVPVQQCSLSELQAHLHQQHHILRF